MRCPRCEREIEALARSCGACALPLAIEEEGEPARLDRAIEIDRRGRPASPLRPSTPLRYAQGERDLSGRAERRAAEPPVVEARLELEPDLDLEPEPEPELERELERELDLELDPDPQVDPDPDRPRRARRALAWVIDAALVAVFAAVPLFLASGPHPSAALRHALLPAAGLLAVLAVAYGAVCHALVGATLGKLALFTKSGRAPRDRAAGTAIVRA